MTERTTDAENEKALNAARNTENLNDFIRDEQQHILRLTGRVLNKNITESDDEYSIALMAVSEAVETYDRTRGDFWSYVAFVIKSREVDYYRKTKRTGEKEITVSPDTFGGDMDEDDPAMTLKRDISKKTATHTDSELKDEIEALGEKLDTFGISFFDLAECSPKAKKSRDACSLVLKAIFTPPPLIDELIRSRTLPIKKILGREKVSRKQIDRHRKYLISAALILTGDYPEIAEYIPFKPCKQE